MLGDWAEEIFDFSQSEGSPARLRDRGEKSLKLWMDMRQLEYLRSSGLSSSR
jgi:hypothetical protein